MRRRKKHTEQQLKFQLAPDPPAGVSEELLSKLAPDDRYWIENYLSRGCSALAWTSRRYYATAELGLIEARVAHKLVKKRLYLQESEVDECARKYWPFPTHWHIRKDAPMQGVVIGAFYYPRPNYYVIDSNTEYFVKGEDPEIVAQKQKKAGEDFDRQLNKEQICPIGLK